MFDKQCLIFQAKNVWQTMFNISSKKCLTNNVLWHGKTVKHFVWQANFKCLTDNVWSFSQCLSYWFLWSYELLILNWLPVKRSKLQRDIVSLLLFLSIFLPTDPFVLSFAQGALLAGNQVFHLANHLIVKGLFRQANRTMHKLSCHFSPWVYGIISATIWI